MSRVGEAKMQRKKKKRKPLEKLSDLNMIRNVSGTSRA